MKDTCITLFIMFIFIGFEWMKTEYTLRETRQEKAELTVMMKTVDSINVANIENNKLLMNRIEYYTKKSHH